MRKPLVFIDALLNRMTMYKLVAWGLMALLAIADVLAFTNVISISPIGLLVGVVLLGLSCYATNFAMSKLLHVATNSESYLITALILACILPPPTTLGRAALFVLAGAIAMVSKYVLVFRGSHVLNPAAIAAFVLSITGLLPATWWIATPALTAVTGLLALAVLRKQRQFGLFFSFAIPAVLLLLYILSVVNHQSFAGAFATAINSYPIIFLGSIMLTEPSTLPPTRYFQLLFGALVGAVFSCQLHLFSVEATPQAALLAGNLFAFAFVPSMGALLKLKQITQLTPNQYDFAFERPKNLQFVPGQYLEWTLPHKKVDIRGNRRMFSIASAPSEADIHIGIKSYQPSSSFKTALLALEPGKFIRGAHVAGSFTLPRSSTQPVVLIAGGIGITPFHSMVKAQLAAKQQRDVTLLYIASSKTDFAYTEDFAAAEKLGVKTRYIIGRMERDMLKGSLPLLQRSHIYISGPDAMVNNYKSMLTSLGVARSSIKTDHFTGY